MRSTLLTLSLALAAATLQAKTFEGTVTYRSIPASGGEGQTLKILMAGGKWRIEPQGEHRGVGAMIVDPKAHSMTLLMPEKKQYMVQVWEPKTAKSASSPKATMRKTGKSDTIAGYKADEWEISSGGKNSSIWATKDLGGMAFSLEGAQGGNQGMEIPEELRKGGFFPLRMQGHGEKAGKLEATSVEPKSLDASLFQTPADYTEMKGLGAGAMKGLPPEAMQKMKGMTPEQRAMIEKMMQEHGSAAK